MSEASVLLGYDVDTQQPIYLSSSARKLSTYSVGLQGMGKSNLLMNIALQDMENGDGVCFITPHADIEYLLQSIPSNRKDDVIVFAPFHDLPIGLNVFEVNEALNDLLIERIADEVVTDTFKMLWAESWGDRMAEVMAMTARTILFCQTLPEEKRPTLAEFSRVIGLEKSPPYREYLIAHIRENFQSASVDEVLYYWQWIASLGDSQRRDIVGSTLNKVRQFRANPLVAHVVGQNKNPLDLRKIMDEGKILLVDLNEHKVGEGNVGLIGSLVVGKLYIEALGRDIEQPKPFHIIADEFGYFATPAFAKLQTRTRKNGIDVLVAHQERQTQLTPETKASTEIARNWIIFAIGSIDAKELAGGFSSEPPKPEVRAEKQDFVLSEKPWDVLQDTPSNNQEISDLVYLINNWTMGEFATNNRLSEWKWLREQLGYSEEERVAIAASALRNKPAEKIFLQKLNRALYLSMREEPTEVVETALLSAVEELYWFLAPCDLSENKLPFDTPYLHARFPGINLSRGMEPEFVYDGSKLEPLRSDAHIICIGWHPGIIFSREHVDTILEGIKELVDLSIHDFNRLTYLPKSENNETEKALYKPHDLVIHDYVDFMIQELWLQKCLGIARNLYIQAVMRLTLFRLLNKLAAALQKYPVKIRGGQPITEYDNPRAFADVTNEWANRLTQLDKHIAWVRLQEGTSLKTYRIKPPQLPEAPANAAAISHWFREMSAQRYGVPRQEVDKMVRDRIQVAAPLPDDDELKGYT